MVISNMVAKKTAAPFQIAYQGTKLSVENKCGVFSMVLGVSDFTHTVQFAQTTIYYC